MGINSSQNPLFKTNDFPAIEYQDSSFTEDIAAANNRLEDLMEKLEDFLSKADQYPEVAVPAKELKIKAAYLRKTEPQNPLSKTVNEYTSAVKTLVNEVENQWEKLNKQFVDAKIAKIKCELVKEQDNQFIASLLTIKEEFAKANYIPVVNYYQRNIDCFKKLINSLNHKNLNEYKNEWGKRYEKFIPNHEQLLKLKDANPTMKFFIKLSEEILKNNIFADEDQVSLQNKIIAIAESPDIKLNSAQIEELREYISTVQTFFGNLKEDI